MGLVKLKDVIMTKKEYEDIVKQLDNKKGMLAVKRLFDILFSIILLVLLSPFIIITSILIVSGSGFPVFFRQERMGKNGQTFRIFKFRTMRNNSATDDGITLKNDNRITKVGAFLRKYRLDEVPQLLNIIRGEMSFVGPRPDLPKYYIVDDYGYKCVMLVSPGVTGNATLEFKDEDAILAQSKDPERTYTNELFPHKVRLNVEYIKNISFAYDIKIMFDTVFRVFVRADNVGNIDFSKD